MKKSTRIACYWLGGITALVVVVGAYFLILTVFTGPPISRFNDLEAPFTSHFFVAFSLINVAFLILLGVAAIRLLKVDVSGVELLFVALMLELAYWFFGGALWLLPAPFGMSAAGATGIGNMGTNPQIFIGYPITGLIAIWALRKFGVLPSNETPQAANRLVLLIATGLIAMVLGIIVWMSRGL